MLEHSQFFRIMCFKSICLTQNIVSCTMGFCIRLQNLKIPWHGESIATLLSTVKLFVFNHLLLIYSYGAWWLVALCI